MSKIGRLDGQIEQLVAAGSPSHDELSELRVLVQELQSMSVQLKKTHIKKLPEHFRRIGYLRYLSSHPKTIFDIGVQGGTPQLYKAFEQLPFILVDPHPAGESILKSRPANYRFIQKGLASTPGKLTFHESGAQSSFNKKNEVFDTYDIVGSYDVEVTTFAALVEELRPEPPFGVKIDTEGFELEVVKGMEGHFGSIDFLICETSVRRVFKDSYQFSELVSYLETQGMLFYNILNEVSPWPRYYDVAFLPRDHPKFSDVR